MMKKAAHWRILFPLILLAWASFALVLTTQTDQVPIVHLMVSTIGSTEFGATIGHAGLFGMLTVVGFLALSTLLPRKPALLLSMSLVLLIATSTELFQTVVAGRSSSLADLLANWLGIFIVGFGTLLITTSNNRETSVMTNFGDRSSS
jgi:VanZ family protein